jgi:membrane protein implicated in regulation of membrane protease activity
VRVRVPPPASPDALVLLVIAILAAVFWLPTGWGIVVVVAATVFELAEAGFWLWLSKRRKVVTGAEALPGARGVVIVPCRPEGQVRVQGELWRARCEEGADVGDEVVVERLEDGLTLIVTRIAQDGN